MILDRLGHRATGLASSDDDDAARRPGREVRRQALPGQGRADRRLKHIDKQLRRIDGHCGFRFFEDGCRGGNLRIPAAAAAPAANALIAIKSAFPMRGLTLSRRRGPQPRGKCSLPNFYYLAMPFHNR
jgi:hypothetical protein